LLNTDNKILPLPTWRYLVNPSVSVHLRNSNKQQLILPKFYINNASSINSQKVKFHLNLPKQAIVTAAFVKLLQNASASSPCGWEIQRPETEVF